MPANMAQKFRHVEGRDVSAERGQRAEGDWREAVAPVAAQSFLIIYRLSFLTD